MSRLFWAGCMIGISLYTPVARCQEAHKPHTLVELPAPASDSLALHKAAIERLIKSPRTKTVTDGQLFFHHGFSVPMPKGFSVHGIDVSRYQGAVDWKLVAEGGKQDEVNIHFTFIKATEGYSLFDLYFQRNWEEAKKHELMRGAYHFFRPHISGKDQAELFISKVRLESGDLPPVLDVETLNKQSPAHMRAQMRIWLERVEQHYKMRPIIYTAQNFYNNYLQGHFDDYLIWVARYEQPTVELKDKREWFFWQHTARGKVPGILGQVDMNVFNGTLEELRSICLP